MGVQGSIFQFKGILSNDIRRLLRIDMQEKKVRGLLKKSSAGRQKQNDWFLAEVIL